MDIFKAEDLGCPKNPFFHEDSFRINMPFRVGEYLFTKFISVFAVIEHINTRPINLNGRTLNMGNKHELMLQSTINELTKQGFRVIRLDKRIIPDAIVMKDGEIIAVEVETSMTGLCLTKRKLENSQYDQMIIITEPYSEHYHTPEVYLEVLKLSKEHVSYRTIRRMVMEKYHLKTLAIGTVHHWIKGLSKPLSLRY